MSEDPGDQKKLSAIRSKTLDIGSSDQKTLGKPLSSLTQDTLVVDARSNHWKTLDASVSSHQTTLGARGSHWKTLDARSSRQKTLLAQEAAVRRPLAAEGALIRSKTLGARSSHQKTVDARSSRQKTPLT